MTMGNQFICQDIAVLDKEALLGFKDEPENDFLIDDNLKKDSDFSFESWDGCHLSDEKIQLLKMIAPFIVGFAEFEDVDMQRFRIEFQDGKVYKKVEPDYDWNKLERVEL